MAVSQVYQCLKESMSAKVEEYYVHLLTMRSVAEWERLSRSMLARERKTKAIYRAIALASTWVRHLIDRGETASMRAATGEE
jgi:hypothetical protein